MDLADASRKLVGLRAGRLPEAIPRVTRVVGMIPVHVGGRMMDVAAVRAFAEKNGLWVVEDAAHALPAAWRPAPGAPWQRCGDATADVTCFSFYANKTITTGEGGMAVTPDGALADRMRTMSLHGLSHDAWERYSGGRSWDYRIIAPGYKYNLTDLAAAIGIHQLARAEEMRMAREAVARRYTAAFARFEDEIETPAEAPNRVESWHLYPIRLRLESLSITRNDFVDALKSAGIGCSVHWRPLHLHPYYENTYGWKAEDLPVASAEWERRITLPLFPSMTDDEVGLVIAAVERICAQNASRAAGANR
jgi:perosamine synthetase